MPFSKGTVNRAGEVLRRWREAQLSSLFSGPGPTAEEADNAVGVLVAYRGLWEAVPDTPLQNVSMKLRELTQDTREAKVSHRLKRSDRIINKLVHYQDMKLARMEDIGGCRVVVPNLGQLRRLEDRIRTVWREDLKPDRGHDYVDRPKDTGYRAVHLVLDQGGRLIEIQLRTINQNRWAELVEDHENRTGEMLKRGVGDPMMLDTFVVMGEALAYIDRGERLPNELLRRLRHQLPPSRVR